MLGLCMDSVVLTTASCLALTASGCAVHWYDDETGTEHIFGFGHLAVKVSDADEHGVRAVVRQSTVVGVGAGAHESGGYAVIGYHADRQMRIRNDTNFWVGWQGTSPFRARVGAVPPWWEGVEDEGAEPREWGGDGPDEE